MNAIEVQMNELISKYGEWNYDIPLSQDVWTKGNKGIPHTRLRRILQLANDLSAKPIRDCRVLDLGCLEGQFAIEFALQGAEVVGIEIREENIQKALFAKNTLALNRLSFVKDDVRNIKRQEYGEFDIIICSGILYHIDEPDVFSLLENMYEMASNLLIIDTHISLNPAQTVLYKGNEYFGSDYTEHKSSDDEQIKAKRQLASWENNKSFWLSRPSIINFLSFAGFSSVYECFNPAHLNFGQPGLESKDRCTFVAVKNQRVDLLTSPHANELNERHPEESLTYEGNSSKRDERNNLSQSIRGQLSKLLGKTK